MKGLIFGTVSLLAFASAIAVPAAAPEAEVASSPVEDRSLFELWVHLHFPPFYPSHPSSTDTPQYPGYKPYKYKVHCPGKPVHDKYLCEKKPDKDNDNEPSHLGWKGYDQQDYEYYLDYGYDNDKYDFKEYKSEPKPKEVCLAGYKGYQSICPVYEPEKYKFPQGWEYKYKQWYISPSYKVLAWLEITLSFLKKAHYWEPPYGYKWICYEDGKGGYDVKVCLLFILS